MRAFPIGIATAVLVCASAFASAADITFHKTLAATGGGNVALHVCTSSGQIHVHGQDGNAIQISATIHKDKWHDIGDAGDMKKIAANPPILQTGNAIHVGDSDTCDGHVYQNIDIDYEIGVPNTANVVAISKSGNIHVETIHGFVHAGTASGDIAANEIGSDSKAKSADSGDARLQTSSGNITATGVRGGVEARTNSGNLTIGGLPTADWTMETSSGNVQFQPDPAAKFSLDVEGGSGKVSSKLSGPVSDESSKGVLRGPVNGGGPVVKIYSVSGNIDVL